MKILLLLLIIIITLLLIAVVRTLLIGSKTATYVYSKDTERIDEYSNKLSKMIQYETVSNPDNPEIDKFRGFHKLLEELFPNVFSKLEKIEIDGNLLMKWKGETDLDPIILTSHLDVVPAEGEWKYPPFSGTIADGKIWGRGAGDIKCGVLAFYQAVEELLIAGYTPKCDVYLGSSCTEEIGGDGAPKLAKYFKDRNIKLYMLSDEGGGITKDPIGGIKGAFAAVGIFEKGYGDLKFSAKSNGGHSSTPPKNTPIVRLAKFESYVEKHNPFKVAFSEAVEAMFNNLAPYSSNFALKLVMANLWLFKPILKRIMPAISSEAAAMLQTTIAFTMQKGSDGYNVIPQEAYVTGNLRYIPHENKDEANKKIIEIAKRYDIETTIIKSSPSSKPLDLNSKQYKQTIECINTIFPNVGIMPYVVTGGTDSRFYSEVCDHCIRFSPVMFGPEQNKGMHGIDENIEQGCLPPAVDYYKQLIRLQEHRA
ncbi:MAG: M20/M25/M40 family metallo-hydrolase [Erysipelotrichaceae bacterium]|nr:M20/M25/M40 family metallo-hydrolase [Erysipelotrichaceae bacterium]